MEATYVSIWDNGIEITSNCDIDLITGEVTDVEQIDVEELYLDILDEEFIRLYNGEEIKDFILDGISYKDGQPIEEL